MGRNWVSPNQRTPSFQNRIAVSWNGQEAAALEFSSFLDGKQSSQTGFRNELNKEISQKVSPFGHMEFEMGVVSLTRSSVSWCLRRHLVHSGVCSCPL